MNGRNKNHMPSIFMWSLILLANNRVCAEIATTKSNSKNQESVLFNNQTASIRIPIQSWKTLRDARVVKQDLDYSCSAASSANLLSELDN